MIDMEMKHLHSIYIAVTILLSSACSYNGHHLSNALKVAGDNRPELETVLEHRHRYKHI